MADDDGCATLLAMSKEGFKKPSLDGRHRDAGGEIRHKRADTMTLGLRAFEKISAVEGVRLTGQMRHEAKALSGKRLSDAQRTGSTDHYRKK